MIKEEIIKAYRKMEEQHPKKEENTVYVTDLLHCVIRPREEIPAVPLIRGTAIHEGIEKLLKENGEIEIDFEKEVRKQYGEYILIGKLDGLTKDNVVIEFKSVHKPPVFPYEEHIYQVLIYMNMIGSDKGLLVYIGSNDISEFSVKDGEVSNIETGQRYFGQFTVNDDWIHKQIVAYFTKTLVATFNECKFCEIAKSCKFSKVK